MSNVLGHSGNCRLRGRCVYMPLVRCLVSVAPLLVDQVSRYSQRRCITKVTGFRVMYTMHLSGRISACRGVTLIRTMCQ